MAVAGNVVSKSQIKLRTRIEAEQVVSVPGSKVNAKTAKLSCAICGGSNVSWLLKKRGYDIFQCPGCDHLFVLPIPSDSELQKIYSRETGYHNKKNIRFSTDYKFKESFQIQIRKIKKYLPKGIILDVGCSNGEFLYLARMNGYDVQGVELNSDTAAIAHRNGIPVHVGSLEQAKFPASSFDVVHMADIIEHARNPRHLLTEVSRVLKPGGLVVLNTPNHEAFFPRATLFLYQKLGIPWSHPTPPYHLHQFCTKSLAILLSDVRLSVTEIYYKPCRLKYELFATDVFGSLSSALKTRNIAGAARAAVIVATVTVVYGVVGLLDRLLLWKKQDFNMHVIGTKDAS